MKDDNSRGALLSALRDLVAAGPVGARLPSVRELQRHFQVSPLTVQQAVRQLHGEGLVDVRPGAGTFVAAAPPTTRSADLGWQHVALGGHAPPDASRTLALHAEPGAGVVRLAGGYLDQTLVPEKPLSAALARAVRRTGAWGRAPVEGIESLRQLFAREIGGVDAADVLITSGGQSALSIAIRALTRPGDAVVLETPTYAGFISIARSHALEVHPVPTDADGLRTDVLDRVLASSGARLVVVQPLHANPTGSTLAAGRRRELLALARSYGAFVLEDDYARDLTIDGPAPPTLVSQDVDGHVVHVRSLSKPVAPALRVAALVARGPALNRLRAAKTLDDFYVSRPLQEAAVDFLSSPAAGRHRRTVARELGARRDTLLSEVRARLAGASVDTVPGGGMHLWVRLPDGVDDVDLAARARGAGVLVSAGSAWFPTEPDASYLRLTYGETPVPLLVEGVRRLATVLVG
ncbi:MULTISPECIES: aminotransferase-like domain-containing protein [unclassified Nocardioides]|uniref:aminotransferase-like domain-containing protein n=1 Tax=unclassified Nocardioides TaxID=2615069 RepID=UPI003014F53A